MNQHPRDLVSLDFKTIEELLLSESCGHGLIGPPAPITDSRTCAGLLFERWNDGSHRSVHFEPGELWCIITIRTERGMRDASIKRFYASRDAIQPLYEDAILEYNDTRDLRLSSFGKHVVVTRWFLSGQAWTDQLAGGARFNEETGDLVWFQD